MEEKSRYSAWIIWEKYINFAKGVYEGSCKFNCEII